MTEPALDAAHDGLRAAGIDFVSGLPDGWQRPLHERVESDPDIRYVPVCNAGVDFLICAGSWLGGKKPALIMGPPHRGAPPHRPPRSDGRRDRHGDIALMKYQQR